MVFNTKEERDDFIMSNRKLVYYRASHILGTAQNDDANQEGMVALIKAVDRFDPGRGFAFSTFAASYIDGYLRLYKTFNIYSSLIKPVKESVDGEGPRQFQYHTVSHFTDEMLEMLMSSEDPAEEAVALSELQNGIKKAKLKRLEFTVLVMTCQGYNQCEIARANGYSHSYINRVLSKVKEKIRIALATPA